MARLIRVNKGTVPIALTGARASVILDNRVRTHGLVVTLRGTLTVAVAQAGATRNGGLLSTIFQFAVNENGRDTFGPARGYMLRQIAESLAAQPLGGTVVPASANVPIGVYPLEETFIIPFADRQINPAETAFMEEDPTSFFQLDVFCNLAAQAAANTLVAPAGGGSTQVLSGLTMTVEQIYAPASQVSQLPIWKPRYRELAQVVAGANTDDLFFVKTESRLRRLTIAQEATITADGSLSVVNDIATALRLIGDVGNVIGPNQSPYDSLVESMHAASGGDTSAFGGSVFTADFAPDGRLGDTIIPKLSFPNFRFEVNDAPSAIVGPSRLVVGIWELTRPIIPNSAYPVVDPKLPDWAVPAGL